MKLKRLTALTLTLLLLLSACTEQSGPPVPMESDPVPEESQPVAQRMPFTLSYDAADTLNPLRATGVTNLALSGLVYEGLFELDASFTPHNVLCASYSVSESGLIWSFTLRAGVSFSDGTPLTAQHVADSLNLARSSAIYAARLTDISSVNAEGNTLTVVLHTPNGALTSLLDIPIVLNQEDDAIPLGTGAYYYTEDSGKLMMKENQRWWQNKSVPLQQIPLLSVSSADDRIAAFDTGLITLVASDLTASSALGYAASCETWDCPTTNLLYLGFNCSTGFCRTKVLRQAISRAIDRSTVVTTLLAGHGDAAVLPSSPVSSLYDHTLAEELTYSVSDAVQLLLDGGYQMQEELLTLRGKTVELTLVVNTDNSFRVSVADYLAQELEKLGLSVTVKKLPWEEYLTALSRGDFDLYLAQVRMTADFDPTALITGSLNYGGYWSEHTNSLLNTFRASSSNARNTAASALYGDLASTLPFAPLCFTRTSLLTQWGAVSDLTPTQQNPFYSFYSWTID